MAIATHVQGWGPEEGGERVREGGGAMKGENIKIS